ncbi:transporter [Flavobacterium rhizosphaerae]|uniref:Transporter n=1 Tax=Flavobacterium rhizosphaerae TaxID=3163298 RepID=A0ABW8YSR7_9FLAO
MKKILLFTAVLFSVVSHAQYTDQINSNRPGQSMMAFAVGKTVFQIETGVNARMEKHNILNYESYGGVFDLSLRYGVFFEELEIVTNIQYEVDQYSDALYTYTRNDFRQAVIGAKYLVFDPDKNYKPEVNLKSWKANHKFKWHSIIPAVAVYAGVNLQGKTPYSFPEDGFSPKAMILLQNHFGKWVWVNNIIADKITTDYPSYGFITTLTRGFNEKWSGFFEVQGYSSDYYADGITRIGAAHLLSDTMQIDASISTNFKNTPSILYGGIGFSWRFDADYNDILLPGKGNREDLLEEDKAKEKKERDRKKKKREAKREFDTDPDGN